MHKSRDIHAALTWWRGAHAYSLIAQSAFRRADLEPFTDPRVIARALGYPVVPIFCLDERWRADVRGRTIRHRWHTDHGEDRLNVFYGFAIALLKESGVADPILTQVWSMTLALALPDSMAGAWDDHPHVPRWLIDLRRSARRSDDSGTRPAIASTAQK
jgi:hypothetical protein